jgi:cytochrome c oxidase subunit 2
MFNWFPENVSTFGGDIDSLFYLILYITGAWFVLTEGLIVLLLIRYRRRKGQRASYVHGNSLRQAAWILVPCVIVLLLDLWIDIRGAEVWARVKTTMPQSELQIQIAAKQFNWEILYPGPDGKLGTADDLQMENELHVPVGKVVRVVLTSKDVLHSFFLPNLRLNQDIVPGRKIDAWFQATKPGKFEIPCAELCGFGHTGMKGWLFIHSAESYSQWVKEQWPQK